MKHFQFPGYRSLLATITVMLLLLAAAPLWSQSGTLGTMTGVVTDSTGAVVPGATVSVKDKSTSFVQTETTNSAGRYTFVNLRPGTYEVTFTKAGFSKVTIPSDVIEVGETSTNNVTLKVGSESQTVEVQASNVELQTLNATVGNTVNGLSLESLPTIQRDTSTFLTLQAGITPDGSVAGAVVDQSSFQLDGGNNTNDMDGSMNVYTTSYAGDPTAGAGTNGGGGAATGVMPTPADSVEEFKVNVAGQGADFNSSAGAQVIVQTKSGTDQWHGSAYEYYFDNDFNANTWQNNNVVGTPKQPLYHYNRFGGSVGGPLISKKVLGGKTYIFANYEGFRYPNSSTIFRAVPSANMRLGLLTFGGVTYNLNPMPVNGIAPSVCPAGPCDPRGLGIDPMVSQLWNQYMPQSNTACANAGLSRCDNNNVLAWTGNVSLPTTSNFGVAKIDHNFGDKWKFFASYRYYNFQSATTQQVDIGGLIQGDKLGIPTSHSTNPVQPWFLVGGLDANLSNTWTNSIRYSFLRNWWQWGRYGGQVQFSGLGGALEPFGETATQALIPYNVNTQQTRTRFWDGQDNMIRDDATWIHGKHMVQFGGMYIHNFNWHQRTDNGGGINYYPTYQLGTSGGSGMDMTGYIPAGFVGSKTNWGRDYAATLGAVSVSQVAYTRSGNSLTLNPPLTPAYDKVTIPYYNFYGGDTWRMTSRFTLTYGLGWTLEMPPTEATGKQVAFVGPDGNRISTEQYLNAREQAALQGQVYNPQVGFALIGNVADHPAYIYNPYYGEWSPRVAGAWDINGDGRTVFRAGYGRTYGRLNGVDLVLVPLLGTGLIQPVQCFGALMNGTCASSSNPTNVFRVGKDGLVAPLPQASATLPQPFYPGVNGIAAGAGEGLDPNFKPNHLDTYTVSFARQINNFMSLEVGYIGRFIKDEYAPTNLNAVPYMMTMGGQTFAKAYANTVIGYCGNGNINNLAGGNCIGNANAVAPQPFFEAALAGTGYCSGYANCTQAVIANEGLNGTGNLTFANVWSLYSDLDAGGFNFPRSMMNTPLPGPFGAQGQLTSGVGMNASIGYGNYNGLFVTFKTQAWKGLTMQSNFTWSKALGTGAVVQATSEDTVPDPFNLHNGYGYQGFDRRFLYNLYMVYQPNFYKSQSGFLGHVAGGWTIAPVFTAGSGIPLTLGTINGGGQAFGEGDSVNYFGYGSSENAIPLTRAGCYNSPSAHYTAPGGPNMFADPVAAYLNFRQPILGYDVNQGGEGVCRGLPYWNMDLSVKKQVNITERMNVQFQFVFINVFNHNQFGDTNAGYLDTSNPGSFGTLNGQVSQPRSIQFGLRFQF